MTLNDIFKNDFIEQTTGALSILEMFLTLSLSLALGIGIFIIYKRTFQGVMYSKTFNMSLVILSLISTTIIVGVTNNIVLSLGMVGALSIVRFRTSIKDPLDVVYMFWAIGTGIITGAGLYVLAIISFLFIGVIIYIFSGLTIQHDPYLLIMSYSDTVIEKQIYDLLDNDIKKYKVKSKTSVPDQFELTIEIKTANNRTDLVNSLDCLKGMKRVAMLSYDGDYAA